MIYISPLSSASRALFTLISSKTTKIVIFLQIKKKKKKIYTWNLKYAITTKWVGQSINQT